MKHFGRLWRGELTLDQAFWDWAVIGGIIINVCSSALFLCLVMADLLILALVVGFAVAMAFQMAATRRALENAERERGRAEAVTELLMAAYMSAEREQTILFPPPDLETFIPAVARGEWNPRREA